MRARGEELAPLKKRGRPSKVTGPSAFWEKVDKTDSCWLWTAYKNANGYGRVWYAGKRALAHRVAWEITNGTIPEGAIIDHLCHTTACVNPGHLRLADHTTNMQNRKGASSHSASGIRGVWERKDRDGLWQAKVTKDGKMHRKLFTSAQEADAWATEMRGELHS